MSSENWAKVHGATVHFPIALILCSGTLDVLASVCSVPATRRGLHAAGFWTMVLGAAGTVPAVVSGLVMSKGILLGHDTLRLHHLFAWPAFALIVGAAAWRMLAGDFAARSVPSGYLAAATMAGVLVVAAGYFGGEMMLGH